MSSLSSTSPSGQVSVSPLVAAAAPPTVAAAAGSSSAVPARLADVTDSPAKVLTDSEAMHSKRNCVVKKLDDIFVTEPYRCIDNKYSQTLCRIAIWALTFLTSIIGITLSSLTLSSRTAFSLKRNGTVVDEYTITREQSCGLIKQNCDFAPYVGLALSITGLFVFIFGIVFEIFICRKNRRKTIKNDLWETSVSYALRPNELGLEKDSKFIEEYKKNNQIYFIENSESKINNDIKLKKYEDAISKASILLNTPLGVQGWRLRGTSYLRQAEDSPDKERKYIYLKRAEEDLSIFLNRFPWYTFSKILLLKTQVLLLGYEENLKRLSDYKKFSLIISYTRERIEDISNDVDYKNTCDKELSKTAQLCYDEVLGIKKNDPILAMEADRVVKDYESRFQKGNFIVIHG